MRQATAKNPAAIVKGTGNKEEVVSELVRMDEDDEFVRLLILGE